MTYKSLINSFITEDNEQTTKVSIQNVEKPVTLVVVNLALAFNTVI